MLNPMSYIRGWLDGKGINHDDMDVESEYIELYNTKVNIGSTFSISWGWSPKSGHAISMGWPDNIEGVYMLDLEYGGEPLALTIDGFKEMVIRNERA